MLHPMKLKRLEKGLSQYVLSFRSGVSQVKICYTEKGFSVLNDRQKDALAKVLGCCVEDLFPAPKKKEPQNESVDDPERMTRLMNQRGNAMKRG